MRIARAVLILAGVVVARLSHRRYRKVGRGLVFLPSDGETEVQAR